MEEKYRDLQQTTFYWHRASDGYYWEWGSDELKLHHCWRQDPLTTLIAGPPRDPPFLFENRGSTPERYAPLDHPTLFYEFADVPPTREGILTFANAYGPLAKSLILVAYRSSPLPRFETRFTEWTDSLQLWESEIGDMREALGLWDLLQRQRRVGKTGGKRKPGGQDAAPLPSGNDAETALDGIWHPLDPKFRQEQEFRLPIEWMNFPPGTYREQQITQLRLQDRINAKLRRYPPELRLLKNQKGNLERFVVPESLLGAMWLQLSEVVSGQKRFRRCDVCGLWCEVTHKRRNWRMHPECSDLARSARYRERLRSGQGQPEDDKEE